MSRQPRPRTCTKCGIQFQPHRLVSGAFSTRAHCPNCYPTSWAPEEDLLLESLAGRVSSRSLPTAYNRAAGRMGLPHRSFNGLRHRIRKLGLSLRATEDNWNASSLAELLMISPSRVYSWIANYRAEFGPEGRQARWAINSRVLRKFARSHPRLFFGINPEALAVAIGRNAAAEVLSKAEPQSKPLRCVETGEVFASLYQAARSRVQRPKTIPHYKLLQVRANIRRAALNHSTAYGYHWEFIDRQELVA